MPTAATITKREEEASAHRCLLEEAVPSIFSKQVGCESTSKGIQF